MAESKTPANIKFIADRLKGKEKFKFKDAPESPEFFQEEVGQTSNAPDNVKFITEKFKKQDPNLNNKAINAINTLINTGEVTTGDVQNMSHQVQSTNVAGLVSPNLEEEEIIDPAAQQGLVNPNAANAMANLSKEQRKELKKPGAQAKIDQILSSGKIPEKGISNTFISAMLTLLPTVVGGLFAGGKGALAGAEVGLKASGQFTGTVLKTQELEAGRKRFEDTTRINQVLAEESREFTSGEKQLDRDSRELIAGTKLRASNLKDRLSKMPKTTAEKLSKLPIEGKKRFDNVTLSLEAVSTMKKELAKGTNTFSAVGDNRFTISARELKEALGRMQSGGAITDDELVTFSQFIPTVKDTKDIQEFKLFRLNSIMTRRLRTLGFEKSEVGLSGVGTSKLDKMIANKGKK